MSRNIRLFLIFLCAIVFANKGVASNNEGVYIVEAESVVFFSDAFQIINLKNEEKIVVFQSKKIEKKECKINKKATISFSKISSKKIDKKIEIKIPLKHLVFNVKNTKKNNLSIFKSNEKNGSFNILSIDYKIHSSFEFISISVYYIYFVQKQVFRDLFYSVLSDSILLKHYSFVLLCFLGFFFCTYLREKSKNVACVLKRGPPENLKFKLL
jgi:hypothetical protein